MKIFLTGGTGFIGSHFINQAHAAGHDIVALRRTPDSKPRITLDREPKWLDKTMERVTPDDCAGYEVLVHLAAHSANVPYDTLENCLTQNVLAPLSMFRAASKSGLLRFIVAGSCFEYGRCGERHEFIPPDAGLEPVSSYPASKAAASVAFHTLACDENLELLILRIFQVYGEGELKTRFWPSLCKAALSGEDFPMSPGLQIRDFIDVTDVATKFVEALHRTDVKRGEPIIENLGSGNPRSLIDFATSEWKRLKATGKILPGSVPMRPNEVLRFVPQI